MDIPQLLSEQNIHFSRAQMQALSDNSQPSLMLAVPGSGKTTVLVARTAYLLAAGTSPARICSLTFSRESARDMRKRFAALFGNSFPQAPVFSTVHSLCWRILSDFSARSRRPLPRMTDSGDTPSVSELVSRCAEDCTGSPPDDDLLGELVQKIGFCKNRGLSRREVNQLDGLPEHFVSIFYQYEAEKKRLRLMDYDDLLVFALDILQKRPAFCELWRQKFDWWNIDEGQDLSPVQFSLIHALCPNGRGLFLVGDEDQSIYGFRGADPDGLLHFPEEYPAARILKMEDNHRSRPEILELCEQFIRRMPDRYDKLLLPTRTPGGTVECISSADPADFLRAVREILAETLPGHTAGILYRSNLSACMLSVFLREAGIPFRLDAEPVNFFRSSARIMAGLLGVCANLRDLDAFARTDCQKELGTPLYENVFLRSDGTQTVPELLRIAASRLPHGENAREMADALERCAGRSPAEALHRLETDTAAGRRAAARILRTKDPLLKLRYAQLTWLCETSPDFPALLRRMQEAAVPAAYRPEEAALTLSTVHSAKGLEFDSVLLIDCADGIFPAISALEGLQYQETAGFREEQRLFYVAATRAREHLFFFEPPASLPGLHLSRFLYTFLEPGRGQTEKIAFRQGERIRHAGFGDGTIVKRIGETAEILFDKSGIKTLSLSHCMKRNMISKIS